MTQIIDRRLNGKNKSAVNRQRFIRRFKSQIRKSVADIVSTKSITDADKTEQIHIPSRNLREPEFRLGSGGRRETVHPGNKEFVTGDRFERPPGGGGGAGAGDPSDSGEGEDEFGFQLSRAEFLDCFFEDLALPNLAKTQIRKVTDFRSVRAGFTHYGVPANISLTRSLRGALARRIALRAPYRARLEEAEQALSKLEDKGLDDHVEARALREEIRRLKAHIEAIPFIDTFDLRYNNRTLIAKPTTQAVMFCLMDVSGSMDESRKELAKRFFMLLYLFLSRSYEEIEVVFIRHHVTAKEVDEDEFFHARETGGTVVSSALKKTLEVVQERYPVSDWNIYVAQASDGENWGDDSQICRQLLVEKIMPLVQYYAYVEVTPERHMGLWEAYQQVAATHENFAAQTIAGLTDIYPVFRRFFARANT